MSEPWVGRSLRRREDERLLRGRGQFVADIDLPDQLHAVFVRSPFAHAAIGRIDTSAALELPGVVAVWSAADVPAAPSASPEADDIVSALVHLGYSRPEAERAVERTLRDHADGRFEDLLRYALQAVSRRP